MKTILKDGRIDYPVSPVRGGPHIVTTLGVVRGRKLLSRLAVNHADFDWYSFPWRVDPRRGRP